MAQRLEAALRKPPNDQRAAGNAARPISADQSARSDAPPPAPPGPSRPARAAEPRPEQSTGAAEAKPNQAKSAIYDTLEQEMANLLGRPSKT
jgi:hypothetical protein